MNEEANNILLRIEDILRGLLRASVSPNLAEIRGDTTLRKVYDMTGTDVPISRIAKVTKMSTGKVSGIWKSWEESGLLAKHGKSYRKLVE
jgi:hypothetical protein